jgi:hypothetical protein
MARNTQASLSLNLLPQSRHTKTPNSDPTNRATSTPVVMTKKPADR